MPITAKNITAEQAAWLKNYEEATGFEPLHQEELDLGEITFIELARSNIRWFEQFTEEAMKSISGVPDMIDAIVAEGDNPVSYEFELNGKGITP